jgi:hypothetical protein
MDYMAGPMGLGAEKELWKQLREVKREREG